MLVAAVEASVLHWVVRDGLCDKVTGGEKVGHLWKEHSRKKEAECKGSGARSVFLCFRNSTEVTVSGIQERMARAIVYRGWGCVIYNEALGNSHHRPMSAYMSFYTSWLICGTAVERSLLHKPTPAGIALDTLSTAHSNCMWKRTYRLALSCCAPINPWGCFLTCPSPNFWPCWSMMWQGCFAWGCRLLMVFCACGCQGACPMSYGPWWSSSGSVNTSIKTVLPSNVSIVWVKHLAQVHHPL